MEEVINLLDSGKLYNVSESVEIAKGKHKIITTWKGGIEKIKRAWLLQK